MKQGWGTCFSLPVFRLCSHRGYNAVDTHAGECKREQTESDRYEELFVNPTLLTLVRQRGNLDSGGAQFVLVRYGNFYQLVLDLHDGHVSVCFELTSNPLDHADAIRAICESGSSATGI
jgi:hypothetical protein